jgi:agmatinase
MGGENNWAKAKVGVLPVPYDSTATYGTGQRAGPNAIIQASRQLELYDIETKTDFTQTIGFFTFPELMCSKKDPALVNKAVEESVHEILKSGRFPLMLGGEHSITPGAVRAVHAHYKDLYVLHIDAHADMRPAHEETEYNHACAMARCREMGPAVSVGIRSYSRDEVAAVEGKYKDYIFDASPLTPKRIEQIIAKLRGEHIYVSIDIDGFDPAVMPATGTPEPGGLGWYEGLALLKAVGAAKTIVGADIVECAPVPGSNITEFACAKLAYKLCGYALHGKKK